MLSSQQATSCSTQHALQQYAASRTDAPLPSPCHHGLAPLPSPWPLQNLLLLAINAPAYVAWQHRGTPLNGLDALAAVLVAGFILLETIADQQQWDFQVGRAARTGERRS